VHARDVLPARVGRLTLGDDLLEGQVLRVDDPGVRGRVGEDLGRHERARVEADGTARDDVAAAEGGAGRAHRGPRRRSGTVMTWSPPTGPTGICAASP
jgi:hypothetical protein